MAQRMNTIRTYKMNDDVNIVTIRRITPVAGKPTDCIDVYVEIGCDMIHVYGKTLGTNEIDGTTKEHITALWNNGYFDDVIEDYCTTFNFKVGYQELDFYELTAR